MKQILFIILLGFLFILPISRAFAETSVTIENNGNGASSDVHVENSTNNGSSSTTVCINGKCETTQGNVDRQEGGAKVKVENKASDSADKKEASTGAKKTEQKQLTLEEMMNNLRSFFNELFSQNK